MNQIKPDFNRPLLAIDTSTHACSVALRIADETFAVLEHGTGKHTEVILAMIDRCLGEARITVHDLAAVAVSAGPGAFTGLRVGAAVASALAVGAGILVGSVSSLALLAAGVSGETELKVLALLDARMTQCYAGFYAVGGTVRPLGDDRLSAPQTLPPDWLIAADIAVGPGLAYRQHFAAHTAREMLELLPDARNLFRCLPLVSWQPARLPIDLRYLRDEVAQP